MSNKNFIIILLIISLLSGIFWCFKFAHDPGFSDDAQGYDETALSINANGFVNTFGDSGIDKPLYPIFLAGVYSAFGHSYLAVRIIQILIFVLICLIIYLLSQAVFKEKIARLMAILMALGYPLASFTGILMREVLFTFFIVLLIFYLFKAQKTLKNVFFVIAGLSLGLAFFTNMVIQYFIILIIINLFIILRKQSIAKVLMKTGLFIMGFLIIVLPWVSFCYSNFGYMSQGGKGMLFREKVDRIDVIKEQYLTELIAVSTGDFFALKVDPDYEPKGSKYGYSTRGRLQDWVGNGGSADEIDKIFFKEAIHELLKQPVGFLQVLLVDFIKFNTPLAPNVRMQHMFAESRDEIPDFVKGSIILIIRLLHYIFLGIIIYTIFKQMKNWSKTSWLILVILYFNLIYTVVSGFARYSTPLYPFYFILFVSGICMMPPVRRILKIDN